MNFKNKNVLVYGLGDSGRAVINVLKELHAHVSFFDDDIKYYEYVGFERNPENKKYDLVIVSPGIKCLGNSLLKTFEDKKIPIISELDFAYLNCKGKILAITGTNGKTTVSMLVNKILKSAGYNTFLCGNIGLPFSAVCKQTSKETISVVEVSNFQLETSKFFRANISCILNLKPDHIDRHGSFEEYLRVKSKIADNLKKRDILILNLDDENTKNLNLHKRVQYFSKNCLKKGVFINKNQIYINKKPILNLIDITLPGVKNLENVLAAVSICSHFNIKPQTYKYAMQNFTLASHRMEVVGVVDGVTYIDDSKATNVASTLACIEAYKNKPIILLLGGLGKEISYDSIFLQKYQIKKVVCFGSDRENISSSAKKFGYDFVEFVYFDEAVDFCLKNADVGDFCLLSPACASFDEFSSYAERGDRFKTLVLRWANEDKV